MFVVGLGGPRLKGVNHTGFFDVYFCRPDVGAGRVARLLLPVVSAPSILL